MVKKADVDALIAETVAKFGRIDILLNNAGVCPVANFLDFTEERFDHTLAANLRGAFTERAGMNAIPARTPQGAWAGRRKSPVSWPSLHRTTRPISLARRSTPMAGAGS